MKLRMNLQENCNVHDVIDSFALPKAWKQKPVLSILRSMCSRHENNDPKSNHLHWEALQSLVTLQYVPEDREMI